MREQVIAGSKVRIAGGTDREGGGDGPLVVLLHGFGAPGDDLVSLYRQMDVPHEVRFAFPEAPIDLGAMNPGYAGARAWWLIDPSVFTAPKTDRTHSVPDGIGEARMKIDEILAGLETTLGVGPDETILGGFSQGAMLALDTALRSSRTFAGIVLLSGTLIAVDQWKPAMPKLKGVPVVQSHGRTDPILPFEAAERLRDLLREAGADLRWVDFAGGHTITGGALDSLTKLIHDIAD
jgi:phospholipase/carboxylesterase